MQTFSSHLPGRPQAALLAALLLTAAAPVAGQTAGPQRPSAPHHRASATAYVQPPSVVAAGPTTFLRGGSVELTARPNLALSFSGTYQFVTTALDVQPSAMPTTTWEAWVYPTRANYSYRQTIFGDDDGNYDRTVIIESYTDKFGVFVGNGLWMPTSLDLNTWQHIAVVYKADGTVLFYKNGQEFTYGSSFAGSGPTGNTFSVGRNLSYNEPFQGQIDEVRVWRTARSQGEVQAGMNVVPEFTAPGLVAAWRFDDNSGPGGTAQDLTGNYPGTLSSSSTYGSPQFVTPGESSILPSTFAWSPATGLNTASGAVVTASPAATTTYTVTETSANGAAAATQTVTVTPHPSLVVSTPGQTIGAGPYTNVTVQSGGSAMLGSDLTVYGAVTVEAGGQLASGCHRLSGPGSFTLAAGATLAVCDAAGLAASGSRGAVQVTGARSFSPDARYVYNGTTAQVTGDGLPAQVRYLTTRNPQGVTLSQDASIRGVLTVTNDLTLAGHALTLLSDASGTAMVINDGPGKVLGATAVVQRYIDGTRNAGAGYRHYSAPVSGATVAGLTTAGFAPTVNAAYNTSATPGQVRPYPTVFGYDQSRLASTSNNLRAFDKGWYSPAQAGDALTVGQGYTVQIGAGEVVGFRGTLTTGDVPVSLARNAGATAADAGWALVGNPYPAPISLARLGAGDQSNLDGAAYVAQSTGPYAGQYRSYINGVGNPVVPVGQGFFVRVKEGQTSGSLTFRDAHRLTTPDATTFQRQAASNDPRPLLQLDLGGQGFTDEFTAYAEAGATDGFDSQFDAVKLPNATGLNLSSEVDHQQLAIDGRPVFADGLVIPLAVGVPAAGTYALTLSELRNLPAGLDVYLRDAEGGHTTRLMAGLRYGFSVTTAQSRNLISGRFTLVFRTGSALGTTPGLSAAQVGLYPNPAHGAFTVTVPGVAGASAVQAELLSPLGQVVRRQQAALPPAGTQLEVAAADLAPGVYVLRLTAGPATLTKRVVLQ